MWCIDSFGFSFIVSTGYRMIWMLFGFVQNNGDSLKFLTFVCDNINFSILFFNQMSKVGL